jgi:tight adherence protein C
MFQILLLTCLFIATAGITLSVFQWLVNRRMRRELQNIQSATPEKSSTLLLGPLTPLIAEQTPMGDSTRANVKKELSEAGFYQPDALTEFRAVRAVLVLVPLLMTGGLATIATRADMGRLLIAGVILSGLGYAIPRLYIQYRGRLRARELERGLPVVIDLLNLALTGGQNLIAALRAVSREIAHSYPVLAEELEIVRQQAELSHLGAALQQFAQRTNHPDVRNLSMVLSQTERLGTDVTAALLEYGNNLRLNMRHRAEAAANRASFWMLFPTILCLSIPAAILLISPVYIEFWKRRDDIRKTFPDAAQKVQQLNKRGVSQDSENKSTMPTVTEKK